MVTHFLLRLRKEKNKQTLITTIEIVATTKTKIEKTLNSSPIKYMKAVPR